MDKATMRKEIEYIKKYECGCSPNTYCNKCFEPCSICDSFEHSTIEHRMNMRR